MGPTKRIYVIDRKGWKVSIAPDMKTAYSLGNALMVARDPVDLEHFTMRELTEFYNAIEAGVAKIKEFSEKSIPIRHIWRTLEDGSKWPAIPSKMSNQETNDMTATTATAEKATKTAAAPKAAPKAKEKATTAKATTAKATTAKATKAAAAPKAAPKEKAEKGDEAPKSARGLAKVAAYPKGFELKDQTLIPLTKNNVFRGKRHDELQIVIDAGAKGIKFEELREKGASFHNIALGIERGLIGIK